MNRRSLLQSLLGSLPFVIIPKAAVARLPEPNRIATVVPTPPIPNGLKQTCHDVTDKYWHITKNWRRDVIYTRGVRRIEGSASKYADYQRDGDLYMFYSLMKKGDYVDRDVFDTAPNGIGELVRRDTTQIEQDIPANTWCRIFGACIYDR